MACDHYIVPTIEETDARGLLTGRVAYGCTLCDAFWKFGALSNDAVAAWKDRQDRMRGALGSPLGKRITAALEELGRRERERN